jgi:hypothetical protein
MFSLGGDGHAAAAAIRMGETLEAAKAWLITGIRGGESRRVGRGHREGALPWAPDRNSLAVGEIVGGYGACGLRRVSNGT